MNLHFLLITVLLSGTVMATDTPKSQRETRKLSERPKYESITVHYDFPVYLSPEESENYVYYVIASRFIETEADFEKKKLADGMEYVPAVSETVHKKAESDAEFAYLFAKFSHKATCIIHVDPIQEKKGFVTGTEHCYVKTTMSDAEKYGMVYIMEKQHKAEK